MLPAIPKPVELLQALLRFDTSNPPGNTAQCIHYINRLLTAAGVETQLICKDSARPNLLARIRGSGMAPPVLLYGHADVVGTTGQNWEHPPFAGNIVDGYVYGRGAVDMKGGIAMLLTAFLKASASPEQPPGDVLLLVVSDEETQSTNGAAFLVAEHPALFKDVRYAIGEFGGCSMYVAGLKLYPIQVAEKRTCWLNAVIRGPAGHGSLPMRGGAMAAVGHLLQRLDRHYLPIHISPVVKQLIETIASALPFPRSLLLRQLLRPQVANWVLPRLKQRGKALNALFRNTVNATMIRGGEQTNVIPGEIDVRFDARLLPGIQPEDLLAELAKIVGPDIDFEVTYYEPGPSDVDMLMFPTLAAILKELDPGGLPVPVLLPGSTDGRHLARLGIQTYGFLPMNLPRDFDFMATIHAANERIPVECLDFGRRAISMFLQRFKTG
jgi:acetylornithine deacetylase/succinyl-diaminopimelate desuccinylase-like protein